MWGRPPVCGRRPRRPSLCSNSRTMGSGADEGVCPTRNLCSEPPGQEPGLSTALQLFYTPPMRKIARLTLLTCCSLTICLAQNKMTPEKEAAIKSDLSGKVDSMKKQAQVMVDSIFSFGE